MDTPELTPELTKKILLRAPMQLVWRALTDSAEFGKWFGMEFDSPFTPGIVIQGVTVPTTVNPQIAELQKPYEGTPVEIMIEEMVPERLFSFRWRPCAVDIRSAQPTTLIVFDLREVSGGVLLTLTESGFECIPLEHRAQAMAMNDQGWDMTMHLIGQHLSQVQTQS